MGTVLSIAAKNFTLIKNPREKSPNDAGEKMPVPEAKELHELTPNQTYWFWLSECGVDGSPLLLFFPSQNDPQGESFGKTVTELRWKAPKRKYELSGSGQITTKGNLVLTSGQDIEGAKIILNYMAFIWPEKAPTLDSTILLKTTPNGFEKITLNKPIHAQASSESSPKPGPTSKFAKQKDVLSTLTEKGNKAYFWFGHNKGKDLTLILSMDRKALKKDSSSLERRRSVSGKVVVDSKGRLEFRTQKKMSDLLKLLVKWVEKNHTQTPELLRLKDAHLSIRNEEGEVMERVKDSSLWKKIGSKR